MTLFMLDTNIVSFLLKKKMPAVDRHTEAVNDESLCLSVITKAELLYGLARRPDAVKLNREVHEFLFKINSLEWDDAAAECYGTLRAALRRRGITIGDMDLLIASHALSAQAILVTHDKIFRHIEGLKTEDWTLPQT